MPSLKELNLLTAYHKGANDIANEFYVPCMRIASSYDRAVGYFNSTIYALAWSALKDFVKNNGRMRIICSPVLSENDIEALSSGYSARLEADAEATIVNDVQKLFQSEELRESAIVLASLVAAGVIDLRIAFVSASNTADRQRLFHDKMGIFGDSDGNKVVFKGSMNETWSGLANDGNLESVDVFLSWEAPREQQRVIDEESYFDLLWENQYPTVVTRPFPEVARAELVRAAVPNWEELVDKINNDLLPPDADQASPYGSGRTPRPHQLKALKEWNERGRRGIFEHATGSGKTFTALCAIRDSLNRKEVPLILVPSDLLLKQWGREIRETLPDLHPQILTCGGGHTEWRNNKLLSVWSRKREEAGNRIVLATLQTASSEEFRAVLQAGEHLFVVVDEAHRIGSPQYQKLLSLDSGPRLGLSATPTRAGDPDGTKVIFDYFQGVVPPPFTLKDAIPSALTPYFYYVHPVHLTQTEQEEWEKVSSKLKQVYAQNVSSKEPQAGWQARVQMLLIERARIVKAASNKVQKAVDIVSRNFSSGQRWILYCDSQTQLQEILSELKKATLPAMEYHSAMVGDREQTLRIFEANGGVLVSIRCLDEGVDIPSVTHALIIASSKNPREFIQRRGRVLRKSRNKNVAYIHDVLVLPLKPDDDNGSKGILEGELARAIEFGKWGENPSSITDLERVALEFGIDYKEITGYGYEDDTD